MTDHELYWQTARKVCTPKQLRILELREIHHFSLRQISYACEVSLTTVRMHLDAGHANIRKELLEEPA